MTPSASLFNDVVRVNEIGAGIERRLVADEAQRAKLAKTLDLAELDRFEADLVLAPALIGWRLTGRVRAEAVQTCGVTLEPLPVSIDSRFQVDLVEADPSASEGEVEVSMDEDGPDLIEDGRIDLGQYAVEQLALNLDPFPRKPGAEFVQPDEPGELSPFAVLKAFPRSDSGDAD
ncbi:YceD family protein [Brevundimonas sp. VNH65]|uniref:YceD family protein n=1 Tax=Brevundimonas sp. VNH65 TaxID=3400917 RepID=UPI003C0EF57C